MKGMIVSVFRDAVGIDCSNRGISSNHENLLLVGDGLPEIFDSAEHTDCPMVVLEGIRLGKKTYIHAIPAENPNNDWFMFGGNFIYSSDSRFPSDYPIPVHDRVEYLV
jgi:hypothetical protein